MLLEYGQETVVAVLTVVHVLTDRLAEAKKNSRITT